MPNCSVLGCVNRSDRKYDKVITYHRFPTEQTRRNDWLKAINREMWSPSKYAVVCSEHFREDCFDRSGNIVKLLSTAIPLAVQSQEQQPGSHMVVILDLAGLFHTQIQPTSSSSTSNMDVSLTSPLITETLRKRGLRSQLESAHKRIKYLEQKIRRLNKRLSTSREMLKHLKKKKLIDR